MKNIINMVKYATPVFNAQFSKHKRDKCVLRQKKVQEYSKTSLILNSFLFSAQHGVKSSAASDQQFSDRILGGNKPDIGKFSWIVNLQFASKIKGQTIYLK